MIRYIPKNVKWIFGNVQCHRMSLSKRVYSTSQQFGANGQPLFTYNSTEGYVRNTPLEDVTVPNKTLDEYVWQSALKWPNHIAVVCGVTGRSYTYAKLRDQSAAFAARLQQKFKLNSGDVVAVCLANIPEYPIAAFGAVEAGLVVTTINPIYTAEEIERQLQLSDAKLLIGSSESYENLRKAVQQLKRDIPIICVKTEEHLTIPDGAIDFREVVSTSGVDFSQLKHYKRHPDDLVFLPFSSGTTGLPKGVKLSHNNIAVNCEQLNVKLVEQPILQPTTNDFQECSPCVLPLFHIYGLTVLMTSKLSLGTKLVTLPRFHPDTFLNSITEHKATMLHLVPPIILYMGSSDTFNEKTLKDVRCVMTGAAPCGAMDAERLLTKAPHICFLQGYGLSETSPAVLISQRESKKFGSVGVLTSNSQAKIININDPEMKGLGPNEQGELLIRGPQVMLGYLNNKAATDEMIVNGWLRTGDMAYYDEDGSFFITDRLKELIKVKGFQVPPAELEEILRSHPDVADAAVIGVQDPDHGEVPRAFVVKKVGSGATEKALKEFVASKTAIYKHLRGGVQFLDVIPKNAAGKILRRDLKLKYCS